MSADTINIATLSGSEKVALMERLWRAMADDAEQAGPPAWHEDELRARQAEWANRDTVAEEWPAVRERLHRTLR